MIDSSCSRFVTNECYQLVWKTFFLLCVKCIYGESHIFNMQYCTDLGYFVAILFLFRIDLTTCSGSTSLTQVERSYLDFQLPSIPSCWRLGSSWLCCRSCMVFTTVSSKQSMVTMISCGLTFTSRRLIMSYWTSRRG